MYPSIQIANHKAEDTAQRIKTIRGGDKRNRRESKASQVSHICDRHGVAKAV